MTARVAMAMRALSRTASITIDVDTLPCYRAIHGLAAAPATDDADVIYARGITRFLELMGELAVPGVLFVVGRDLDRDAHARLVGEAARAGHEIASHSHAHDYALSRSAPAVIDADLTRASEAIARVSGRRPIGFRAPGYNLSEPLMDALERQGFAYDSSLFPTPAYFAARAAAKALHALAGRESRSLTGDLREFAGPRAPYRPSRAARHRPAAPGEEARALVEIPMTVASPLRLPWLGTSLALAPDPLGKALSRLALSTSGPVVLELHGMDLVGSDDGVDDALARVQPDLRVSSSDKVRRVRAAIAAIAARREIVPLVEVAARAA